MTLISDLLGQEHQKLLRPSGGCHNCPLGRKDFVPSTLKDTDIIIVGEAPGAQEVKEEEGFVSPSGQLLRASLEEVGITDYSLTNTAHCRPPKNRNPSAREIECCLSQFTLDEIRGYPLVVLVGGTPMRALFPGSRGTKYRGNVAWHPDFPGQRFYSIYHPAYILRRRDKRGVWDQQMARLARIHQEVKEDGDPPFQVVRGRNSRFWEGLQEALTQPLISLDIETNRLESWTPDARIRSVALTADGKRVYFVHEDEPRFLAALEAIKTFLLEPRNSVVGHNIGFDLDWLEESLGFTVALTGIHDTQKIYYELRQYQMVSLKELVSRELDGYRYLIHSPDQEADVDLLASYNAEDVVYPLELFRRGMKEAKPTTRDLLTRVSGPTGYILRKISNHGIHLRLNYWRELIEQYDVQQKEVLEAWAEEDPQFIPTVHDSGNGLKKYLFTLKKLPVKHRTAKGAPETGAGAIKDWIREGATYLRHLLELRRIEKIRSTYLTAYEKHLGSDGRIHSSYTGAYTDSGRSSSRSPNMQNIPRAKDIRDLFGVSEGGILMESDLSQIEFRIMISLAKDPNGIAAYLRGEDAHTMTARSFSKGLEPTKEERTQAKAINFALLYGGDWYNVQRTARDWYGVEWTEEQCREFVTGFWRTYQSLPEFHEESRRRLIENRGMFRSVTGHSFYYQDWDHPDQGKRDHAFRAALNSEAQGPAAQICFLIMIHAHRMFAERKLPAKMVNTVHDSAVTEITDPKRVGEVVAVYEEAKDLAYSWVRPWFRVPLEIDHEVGPSWGSLEEWTP